MIRTIIFSIFLFYVFNIQAQELKVIEAKDLSVIKLNTPDKTRGSAIMKALNDRQSIREYKSDPLRLQDLSDLLWAANGINRPDGKRTAPSCRDFRDVEIFVVLSMGAYHYDVTEHALNLVTAGDFRGAVAAGQAFAKEAPLCIVLVADMSKYGNMSENSKLMAAIDVGIVCQNINVACAGLGLATVPRGTMDQAALRTALKLTDQHLLLMNNPVGYPK